MTEAPARMTTPLYLDDLQVGQRFTSGTHELDEAQILAYARQFDPQPFHTDPEAARHSLFGGRAPSGLASPPAPHAVMLEGRCPLGGRRHRCRGRDRLAAADPPRRYP